MHDYINNLKDFILKIKRNFLIKKKIKQQKKKRLSLINSDNTVTKLIIFVLLLAIDFISTKTEFLCPDG